MCRTANGCRNGIALLRVSAYPALDGSRSPDNRPLFLTQHSSDPERLGVMIVGDCDPTTQIAAIERSPHLGLQPRGEAGDQLHDPSTHVVVVCTAPEDRSYWIEAGLAAGHWVVSPLPQKLPESTLVEGARYRVDAPLAWSDVDADLQTRARHTPNLSYVRATIQIPARWVHGEGILLRWGAWLPLLLQRSLGPIDTLHARSRCHRHDGLWEDHVLAHLTFANGVEAHVEMDALGSEAEWHVDFLGGETPNSSTGDIRRERASGLTTLYDSLGQVNPIDAVTGGRALREAMFLVYWIRQSARLERMLTRREARRT